MSLILGETQKHRKLSHGATSLISFLLLSGKKPPSTVSEDTAQTNQIIPPIEELF